MTDTPDILPTHALMALWESQLSLNDDEFNLITSEIDPQNLIGGSIIAVTFTASKWSSSYMEGVYNIMEVGRAVRRVAEGWRDQQAHSAEVVNTVDEYGLALIMAPRQTGTGVEMEFFLPGEHGTLETAMASLVPLNILSNTAVQSGRHRDGESFRAWLRESFWKLQAGQGLV
ncbi:hypothetical protein [Aeromicrobium sp. 179-A 4D2 NHS]|uniref:hypothetical protein n=1 Tax=Aeromicrobium sp. 179-A 4D2 NHS TaxID=3142375 RepID=UPI0039A1A4F6